VAGPSDPIPLSYDGVVWNTALTGGLFDGFSGAVPGDSVTRSYFVKNPTDSAVVVETRALNVVSSNSALAQSITVIGSIGSRSLGAPVTLASLSNCSTLAPDLVVAPRAIAKVTITLSMLNVTGHTAQTSAGGFEVLVNMKDAVASLDPSSCGSAADPGGNAGSGDPAPGAPGAAGAPAVPGAPSGIVHPTSSHPRGASWLPLAFTGIDAVGPFVLGMVLMGLGLLLIVARRRRKERHE
jgi:LPXTG-motif cell wall-anchored protein